MASDIAIVWDDDLFEGDLQFLQGDLKREEGLYTAVMMSLFTDARAEIDDELPDPSSDDRRGWWGDQFVNAKYSGDRIGSKLWLLSRAKTDQDTLTKAAQYAKDALQWMVDDEVAADVQAFAERIERLDKSSTLALKVEIYKDSGDVETFQFDDLWEAQFLE